MHCNSLYEHLGSAKWKQDNGALIQSCAIRLRADTSNLDRRKILHGLLASQNCLLPQYGYNGWLWDNRLHHWWTNSLCRQWRDHVNCCWHHHRCSHKLGRGRVRPRGFPRIRTVSLLLFFSMGARTDNLISWAWIPQLMVLLILVGSAGPNFNSSLQTVGDPGAVTANRLSFFSLSLSVPVSWAGAASDFYVYYPENTKPWKAFLMTCMGLTLSFTLVNLLGVGLASGIATTPAWSDAYNISSGALILAGYDGLRGFGKFCGVIVALGVIANNIPGTYAAALGCQVLGRYGKAVPRYIWVCVIVLIYFVCAIAGRNNLFDIFENFLALMGYWVMIFISIVLEEHLIFKPRLGFDWSAWEDRKILPVGIAALIAFLVGWAGAIIGMYQVWYVGPVAAKVGGIGADIGIWIGCAFTLTVFPPLRYWELKKFGR